MRGASGAAAAGVTRHSFAVFMQPRRARILLGLPWEHACQGSGSGLWALTECLACRWDEAMDVPPGADAEYVGLGQWAPGIIFGHFSELTISHHYNGHK